MAQNETRSPIRTEFRFASVFAVLFILAFRPAFADDVRRAVVILYSYDSSRSAYFVIDAALRRVLQSRFDNQAEIYSEFLDYQRFPEPNQQDPLAAYLHAKFAGRRIDLVIAFSAPAVRFLAPRRHWLFPDSRLMFVAASEARERDLLGPDASGLTLQYDPVRTVSMALRLEPDVDRIIVVSGNTRPERDREAAARHDLDALSARIKIEYWSGMRPADIIQAAAKLPPKTVVLYFAVGGPSVSRDLARKLAAVASVPVYSQFDDYTGLGVVGGRTTSSEDIGRETGELAVRVLMQHASGIRVSSTSTNIVDWRQLHRWGFSEANMPPGTVVLFRPPSLWAEHRWAVMGAVAALALQALLITTLIVQALRRRRAQAALEQRQQELAHLGRVSLLGELSGAIAHEINNPLTAILSNAQAAKRFLRQKPGDTGEVGEILDDIAADSKRAGNVIRRLRELFKKVDAHLEPVDLNGIVADVLELADRRLLEDNVSVTTKLATDPPAVRADPVQLKQVLLNLVVNACDAMAENKAGDRSLAIATSCDEKRFAYISVSDRGSGIAASVTERIFQPFVTTKSAGIGLGLSICRSIIEAHGGRLSASNNPDRGATFSVALPVEGHMQTAASRSVADIRSETPS